MKIARFVDESWQVQYGVVEPSADGRAVRAEVIEGNIFGRFSPSGVVVGVKKLLAPVSPPNVIAIGLNYRDHAKESGMAIPEEPVIFLKATSSVVGPEDAIVLPAEAPDEVDYEAELVVVIGKRAKDVSAAEARGVILGYTCGNDVSARDCQLKRDKQWARGKSFDTFCPIGPWLVTADALDPSDLAIKLLLNNAALQNSRTSELIFGVDELISFLSRQFTLLPGTVIMTGTPPGVGFALKPPKYLKAGDDAVVEIEGIGRLRNP
ncbi:MAG: fumarylacetoacetate hydrolase family protein, partial [Phycisphaerae bacterium]|nr:fumarylacetoacetate hydrolase family protein [Phycisphaerae bacterium]